MAFVANKDQSDNFDIYVKLIGSSEPLRLTRDPAAEFSPAWSPDGRQIAFLQRLPGGKATVMLMSALGGAASKLTEIQTFAFADLWCQSIQHLSGLVRRRQFACHRRQAFRGRTLQPVLPLTGHP